MRILPFERSCFVLILLLGCGASGQPDDTSSKTPTAQVTATSVPSTTTATQTLAQDTATAADTPGSTPPTTSTQAEITATQGCEAVPVCDSDPSCHFRTDSVAGLSVSCSREGGAWIMHVEATGLPDHAYSTGNGVVAQDYVLDIPLEPELDLASQAVSCPEVGAVGVSGLQGILINGVGIHRALTPELYDPVNPPQGEVEQPIDPCDGHGTNFGQYHLHTLPVCLFGSFFNGEQTYGADSPVNETSWDKGLWGAPSGIIGFSLVGHPIFGPYADENETRHSGLDACNGRLSADQKSYAYYTTENTFPYLLGCNGPGKALEDTTAEDWACTSAPPELP